MVLAIFGGGDVISHHPNPSQFMFVSGFSRLVTEFDHVYRYFWPQFETLFVAKSTVVCVDHRINHCVVRWRSNRLFTHTRTHIRRVLPLLRVDLLNEYEIVFKIRISITSLATKIWI